LATSSQKRASATYRRRSAAAGLVRVEVQAARSDAALIRDLARTLREDSVLARSIRQTLEQTLAHTAEGNALDLFRSDLPDEAFDGVFEQPRPAGWRPVDL